MAKWPGEIIGWGAYAPERVLTNEVIAQMVETSDEWIVQRTGIRERRVALPGETTTHLALEAGQRALAHAGLTAADVDLIIVATSSPDYLAPTVANQVQHLLGAEKVPAFVVVAGCTGFIYALVTAYQFLQSGQYRHILVIGAELLSRFIDWNDRATCVLFGDGAGAVVLRRSDAPCGLDSFLLGSDGGLGHHLVFHQFPTRNDPFQPPQDTDLTYIHMNGREVFKFATRVVGDACRQAVEQAGLTFDDIDWIIPHQANLRIIDAAARALGLPLERFAINIDRYGNTSAASIPLALVEYLNAGHIKPHHRLLLVGFGAGLTWGASVLQMAPRP